MLSCMNLSLENPLPLPLPVACALAGILRAMIGSFLNVVIHRLPREQSIVFPNSSCPRCHVQIKPYDNIPILSFLILRGQCRACGAPISARYPAVEALTGLLFAAVTWHDGWSFALGFDLAFAASILAAENVLLRVSAPTGKLSPLPSDTWPTETFSESRRSIYLNQEGIQIIRVPLFKRDRAMIIAN